MIYGYQTIVSRYLPVVCLAVLIVADTEPLVVEKLALLRCPTDLHHTARHHQYLIIPTP